MQDEKYDKSSSQLSGKIRYIKLYFITRIIHKYVVDWAYIQKSKEICTMNQKNKEDEIELDANVVNENVKDYRIFEK